MMLVIIFMLTNNKIIDAINLNGKILNNVYVQDINLSDLTKEEATKKINSYIEQNNEFELFYNNESILVNKETLGVDYKVDELVDRGGGGSSPPCCSSTDCPDGGSETG